jgi:hypothetical protein
MKHIRTYEDYNGRKQYVNNLYESLKEKYTYDEVDELVGEGLFSFISGLFLNSAKKRQLKKLAEELVKVRVEIGKIKIEGDPIEEYEDELESKYDELDYNAPSPPKSVARTETNADIKIEALEQQESDILDLMDNIGQENETLAKFVSKIKIEARFNSTKAIIKYADGATKRILQKLAKKDEDKMSVLNKQINNDLEENESYKIVNEYADLKGSEVWKHIKDITPEKENIPNGFKKDIVGRTFANVDDFDMKSLLKTDPDFKDYYDSGEERYDEDDVSPRDLSLEIVVVDGVLLDGYSRVANLLRNGEKTTSAFIAK